MALQKITILQNFSLPFKTTRKFLSKQSLLRGEGDCGKPLQDIKQRGIRCWNKLKTFRLGFLILIKVFRIRDLSKKGKKRKKKRRKVIMMVELAAATLRYALDKLSGVGNTLQTMHTRYSHNKLRVGVLKEIICLCREI